MVDASLRPRPGFGTFLQSDNSVQDGLTYYDYQRLVRSKKVALLQEKRERSHEPGYKKSGVNSNVGPVSRRIFQLKSRHPAKFDTSGINQPVENNSGIPAITKTTSNMTSSNSVETHQEVTSKIQLSPLHATPSIVCDNVASGNEKTVKGVKINESQTERLPRISSKIRVVKSASARGHHLSCPSSTMTYQQKNRPKTVSSTRDSVLQTDSQNDDHQHKDVQTELVDTLPPQREPVNIFRRSSTEGSPHVIDLEDGQQERDALARAFTWRTSSQRASDEIGWNERVPTHSVPPPASTVEQFPDPVSMRLTFRRYNSEPAEWQMCGTEWDFVQSRPGNFTKGPQGMNYSNSSQKTQQIPGYFGHITGSWSIDNPSSSFKPALLVRSIKPRPTEISRRQNIPGYMGHVHWTSVAPAHSNMPLPEPTTSARTHRYIPLEEDVSPFGRTGVFSKMVTTVSPHNPYNKVES